MLICRRAEADKRVHVGNADADSDRAVGDALRDFDLIEVARFPVVDR